jgi:hypothetical protein
MDSTRTKNKIERDQAAMLTGQRNGGGGGASSTSSPRSSTLADRAGQFDNNAAVESEQQEMQVHAALSLSLSLSLVIVTCIITTTNIYGMVYG